MKFFTANDRGFSLVEVLVAITILLMVIVGPMQIIGRSINSTNFASEQVNAWFLAQEGLELAQRGRDDLVLQNFKDQLNPPGEPSPFAQFLTDYASCFSANPDGCGLNIGNGAAATVSIVDCATNACKLYLDSTTERSSYQHDASGAITPYTRVVTMQRVPATGKVREIKVTSTVSWRTGSLISGQSVEAVTYLFNVYDTN
jgi:prepilin-type N-terminal cleavage/methylation domain-containing protein